MCFCCISARADSTAYIAKREAGAITAIVGLCIREGWEIFASEMIDYEISQQPSQQEFQK
jgi:hypothetical protein